MIVAIVVVVFLVALFCLVWGVVGSHGVPRDDIRCLSPKESGIDLDVLSRLLSREENEYLRESLPEHEFRMIKRRRVSLARKYLKAINTNTRELIRAAEAARSSSSDAEVAKAANELVQMAFRVRLKVPLVYLCLLAEWLFPTVDLIVPPKLDRYRDMVERIVLILQRLHAAPSGTSSAG